METKRVKNMPKKSLPESDQHLNIPETFPTLETPHMQLRVATQRFLSRFKIRFGSTLTHTQRCVCASMH